MFLIKQFFRCCCFMVTLRRKPKLPAQPSCHILIRTSDVSQANTGGSQHKGDSRTASMHKHAHTGHPMPPVWLWLEGGRRHSQGKPNNLLSLIKSRVKSRGGLRGGWGEAEGGMGGGPVVNWRGEDGSAVGYFFVQILSQRWKPEGRNMGSDDDNSDSGGAAPLSGLTLNYKIKCHGKSAGWVFSLYWGNTGKSLYVCRNTWRV